jgi:energy-coupling factor transporter ATP-binding protein EcfA2
MTEPAEIAMLQARLEQQREELRLLLRRINHQGGKLQTHLVFLRRLVEVRAELVETKAHLSALGMPVENEFDDNEFYREDVAKQALDDRTTASISDIAVLRSCLERQRRWLASFLRHGPWEDGPETPRVVVETRAKIAQIKARLQTLGAEVADHPDDGPSDKAIREAAALPSPFWPFLLSPDQRAELLAGLAQRYQEHLERALTPQGRFPLRLRDRSDAVDPTWRGLRPHVARPTPPPTTLSEAFEAHQQLLVLGDAGSGKTTLLLELALALTRRAQADAAAPIPLLLNLASAPPSFRLLGWLLEVLPDWLAISSQEALNLASGKEVALLLDGLDEVPMDQRAGWVETISAAATECDPLPLVVACDRSAYDEIGAQLELNGAIELEGLELPVVGQALRGAPAAEPLLAVLRSRAGEVVGAPQLVHLVLAAGDQAPPVGGFHSLEAARAFLWGACLRRALVTRLPYPWEVRQVLRALRRLGQELHAQGLITFAAGALPLSLIRSPSLRAVLRARRLFPQRARALLERLCERGVLEREGQCYRFSHVLLRDWCAGLSDAEIEALAAQLPRRS